MVNFPMQYAKVLILDSFTGSRVSVDGDNSGSDEFLETAGHVTSSASGSRDLNNMVAKHANGDQGGVGSPSSSDCKPSTSSACKPSTSSGSHMVAVGGRKRAALGGMRKLGKKYLCFIPF